MQLIDGYYTHVNGKILPQSDDNQLRLFKDTCSEEFFWATVDRVKDAIYHLNRNFQLRGYVLLAEFYEMLDIFQSDFSKTHGWNSYEMGQDGMTPWIDIFFKDVDGYTEVLYYVEPTHISTWEDF